MVDTLVWQLVLELVMLVAVTLQGTVVGWLELLLQLWRWGSAPRLEGGEAGGWARRWPGWQGAVRGC